MIVYCSTTLHVHWNKSQQLFYIVRIISTQRIVILVNMMSNFDDITSQTMLHEVMSTSPDEPLSQRNKFIYKL